MSGTTTENTMNATLTAYKVLRYLSSSVRTVSVVWATSPLEAIAACIRCNAESIRTRGPAHRYQVLLNGRRVY